MLVAPAGAGPHVITRAHVVEAASLPPGDAPSAAAGRLGVGLPGSGRRSGAVPLPDGRPRITAPDGPGPGARLPDSRGRAVLAPHGETCRLPAGTGPLPLARRLPGDGRRAALAGHPRGSPAGLLADARETGRGERG
ncbi:hypothetical protein [Streptomyces glaucescens]|uniref:hypothetical protein n=1 Tax=Streptomyces glaucescens TaxID=1907 RepID=UPI0006941659|nr:hypothetical protein [Streptomyces glaucescens]